ncbi:hypothetical protein YB2330_005590 [Saitoella coloradoensis]
MPITGVKPAPIAFPAGMYRLGVHSAPIVLHLSNLARSKAYREERGFFLVQGARFIQHLLKDGFKIASLFVTAPELWKNLEDVRRPALNVIENPSQWPAERQYLVDIDRVRRILGSRARPYKHELLAEIARPNWSFPKGKDLQRLIYFHKINYASNLGQLVRTARLFGWQAAARSRNSIDFFALDVLAHSRAQTIYMPHKVQDLDEFVQFANEERLQVILCRELPESQLEHQKPNTLHLWRSDGVVVPHDQIPKRFAIIVSGDQNWDKQEGIDALDLPVIHASIPMPNPVGTMHSSQMAAIVMWELNKLTGWKGNVKQTKVNSDQLHDPDESAGLSEWHESD